MQSLAMERSRMMADDLTTEVTITKGEYERLRRCEDLLECLQDAGVDNWEWYSEAMKEHVRNFPEFYGVEDGQ